MKTICLFFQIHQPFRLKNFPFFEIGNGTDYFDEELNSSILQKEVLNYYLPINRLLLKLIYEHENKFNISFSLSGTVLDQFEKYSPEVIASFQELYDTGCVEFVGETYAHSLAALKSRREFAFQVKAHSEKIHELFGAIPKVFRISQLTYTDAVGQILFDFGFDKVILEGIDTVSKKGVVNRVYRSAILPELKLLVNNHQLSDDISMRFSDTNWEEFPLTAEKYVDSLKKIPGDEQFINISLNYGTLGRLQQNGWGVFDFIDQFIRTSLESGIKLSKPSQLIPLDDESALSVSTISFSRENNSRQDIMCRLGNDIQQEAFFALYNLEDQILACSDSSLNRDWLYLQSSDHFYFMCTNHFSSDGKPPYLSPYEGPFQAYINYMNVLSDLRCRAKILLEELPETKHSMQEETQKSVEIPNYVYQASDFQGLLAH